TSLCVTGGFPSTRSRRPHAMSLSVETPSPPVSAPGGELVAAHERTSTAREFLWIWHSAQFSFGVVVLGSVPVSFGLGWWGSVTSALLGVLIGTLVFAPLARFGMRTGATD